MPWSGGKCGYIALHCCTALLHINIAFSYLDDILQYTYHLLILCSFDYYRIQNILESFFPSRSYQA